METTSSERRPFSYEALSHQPSSRQIRLLKLFPAASLTDDIQCELLHTSLDDHLVYEAVSYAWGDPRRMQPISLNGRHYSVTKNLNDALRHIRKPDLERLLWIDALCINQEDIPEKNHQVRQMRDVYVCSDRVLVWLGVEGDAKVALDHLVSLTDADDAESWTEDDQFKWDAYYSLFYKRPWWQRTWILQEVLHRRPAIACIGNLEVDLDYLCERRELFSYIQPYREAYLQLRTDSTQKPRQRGIRSTISHLNAHLQSQSQSEKKWKQAKIAELDNGIILGNMRTGHAGNSIYRKRHFMKESNIDLVGDLFSLVVDYSNQQASDPKDKIFSLLGMAIVIEEMPIIIDYKLSKRDVYLSAAKTCLSSSLHVIFMAESKIRPVSTANYILPSWVPDFTIKQDSKSFHLLHQADLHRAAGPASREPPTVRFSNAGGKDILLLTGIYAATVTGIHSFSVKSGKNHEDFKLIRYDRNRVNRNKKLKHALWPSSRQLAAGISYINVSWAPYWVEIGDIIIVARGSCLPIVLRAYGSEYLFIGSCLLTDSKLRNGIFGDCDDPGYSSIMRGSVWDEVGRGYLEEEFSII